MGQQPETSARPSETQARTLIWFPGLEAEKICQLMYLWIWENFDIK